jgi:hypothetical protein
MWSYLQRTVFVQQDICRLDNGVKRVKNLNSEFVKKGKIDRWHI